MAQWLITDLATNLKLVLLSGSQPYLRANDQPRKLSSACLFAEGTLRACRLLQFPAILSYQTNPIKVSSVGSDPMKLRLD